MTAHLDDITAGRAGPMIDDAMRVVVVAGRGPRSDWHTNDVVELFYQLTGDISVLLPGPAASDPPDELVVRQGRSGRPAIRPGRPAGGHRRPDLRFVRDRGSRADVTQAGALTRAADGAYTVVGVGVNRGRTLRVSEPEPERRRANAGRSIRGRTRRDVLSVGRLVMGPALIDDRGSTTVVLAGYQAEATDAGMLLITPITQARRAKHARRSAEDARLSPL
jgi:hypothetical protein